LPSLWPTLTCHAPRRTPIRADIMLLILLCPATARVITCRVAVVAAALAQRCPMWQLSADFAPAPLERERDRLQKRRALWGVTCQWVRDCVQRAACSVRVAQLAACYNMVYSDDISGGAYEKQKTRRRSLGWRSPVHRGPKRGGSAANVKAGQCATETLGARSKIALAKDPAMCLVSRNRAWDDD